MIDITVRGRTIPFSEDEVRIARKSLDKYFSAVKKHGEQANCPTYYYTLLVTAYIMINDIFDSIDPELLELLYRSVARAGSGSAETPGE